MGLDRATSRGALHAPRRDAPVTRVLEANTRRVRTIPQGRPASLLSIASARDSLSRASGARRRKPGRGGSRLAGLRRGDATGKANATGIRRCRRAAGRKPHSRARINRSFGCARVSKRLQKSTNDAEASRGVTPLAREHADGGPTSGGEPQGEPSVAQSASRTGGRGSNATTPAKARAGRPNRVSRGRGLRSMEGTSGRLPAHPVHAGGLGTTSAALEGASGARAPGVRSGEATGVSEVRSARTRAGRRRPPAVTRKQRATHRSVMCTAVKQATTPRARASNRHDAPGTDETRVPVRRPSEMAEVGPTHPPRPARRRTERFDGEAVASRGAFRTHALTRGAAASR